MCIRDRMATIATGSTSAASAVARARDRARITGSPKSRRAPAKVKRIGDMWRCAGWRLPPARRPRYRCLVSAQYPLFATPATLAEGMAYRPDFLDADEERELLRIIETLPLQAARYKTFTAKRRIVSYGAGYDFDRNDLVSAPPLPDFLLPLRARVAAWAEIPPERFS